MQEPIKLRPALCSVQVWAKGFQVSEATSELQLVVPASTEKLSPFERHIPSDLWRKTTSGIYGTGERRRTQQFALLLTEQGATVATASVGRDQRNRQSIVAVACSIHRDDSGESVAQALASAQRLSRELSLTLSEAFSGAPEHVAHQLRDGTFLESREFQLPVASPQSIHEWSRLARELEIWGGISGVATPIFMPLGANVLIGTEDEWRRLSPGVRADAYLVPGSWELFPMTDRIGKLPRSQKPDVEEQPSIKEVLARLDELQNRQDYFESALKGVFDIITRLPLLLGKRKRKK